jgi:hypothetical protein
LHRKLNPPADEAQPPTNLQAILFGTQNATVENTLFGLSPAADAGRVIDFFLRVDF